MSLKWVRFRQWEGATAGPVLRIRANLCGSEKIRETPQNGPQQRLPIGGTEPIESILWVRRTHFRTHFKDISPYPSCQGTPPGYCYHVYTAAAVFYPYFYRTCVVVLTVFFAVLANLETKRYDGRTRGACVTLSSRRSPCACDIIITPLVL